MTENSPEQSLLLISLLKGVLYRTDDPKRWQSLLDTQAALRDWLKVIGLCLHLDEAEGYAWLAQNEEDDESALPRLIARRPLSYPLSLLLALLRKRLAEADAGGETRLILSQTQIIELLRLYLPDSSNEAKLADQLGSHINKAVELGFLRRLRGQSEEKLEVQRILKVFVDGQWLAELEQRLQEYAGRINLDTDTEPAGEDG